MNAVDFALQSFPLLKVEVVSTLPQEVSTLSTKSAQIRKLSELGWERKAIAKALDIRYQHVRNVLVQPLKKAA